jgi:hypothetical protein
MWWLFGWDSQISPVRASNKTRHELLSYAADLVYEAPTLQTEHRLIKCDSLSRSRPADLHSVALVVEQGTQAAVRINTKKEGAEPRPQH